MRKPRGRVAGLFALSLMVTACQGSIGGSTDDSAPPPPDVTPLDVPANPEVIEGEGFCVAMNPGEKLVASSPEGHAWLVASEGGVSTIRVLDAFDSAAEVTENVELSNVTHLHAWSSSDAALLADDGLWRLEQLARVQLTPPEGFAAPATLCGDPGTNGAMVSSGLLFERRDDSQWWGWDPGTTGDESPTELVRFEGECQGVDDVTWMTSPDGTLWQVEPAQVFRPVRFENLVAAAGTSTASGEEAGPGTMLAILESDRLWVGPSSWQSWLFAGSTPKAVHASGGYLWMLSGQQLLRFDGASWVEVRHPLDSTVARLAAHQSGLWLQGATEVCHVAASTMVRVVGIRPNVRSIEFDYPIDVLASDGSTPAALLDGEVIELTEDMETGMWSGKARLDDVGWHELVLSAGDANRSMVVKRLPEETRSWAADILPIYEANCTGGDCHDAGATDPPDLSTYEAWTTLSTQIRTRVIDAGNMPPAANQGPDWGDDDVAIIAQWLEGGMLP